MTSCQRGTLWNVTFLGKDSLQKPQPSWATQTLVKPSTQKYLPPSVHTFPRDSWLPLILFQEKCLFQVLETTLTDQETSCKTDHIKAQESNWNFKRCPRSLLWVWIEAMPFCANNSCFLFSNRTFQGQHYNSQNKYPPCWNRCLLTLDACFINKALLAQRYARFLMYRLRLLSFYSSRQVEKLNISQDWNACKSKNICYLTTDITKNV